MLIALAVAGTIMGGPAFAEEKGTIELTCIAEKEIEVIKDDGEKELKRVPPGRVIPGDTIVYTITYKNVGDSNADNEGMDENEEEAIGKLTTSYEDDLTSIRHVNSLSLEFFRSKLVEHFNILFEQNKLV